MAVVADPDIVNRQPLLAFLYRAGGFSEKSNGSTGFLIFLGTAIFILIILITIFRTGVLYIAYRFTANRRYTLSVRLFKQYLFQPYHFFLNHNTGELSKNLLAEVDLVINSVLYPAMDAFVKGALTLAILSFLVIVNPLIAALAAVIFGVLYLGLYALVRSRLTRSGVNMRAAYWLRYKISAEAFGGIKDIKILGKEPFFSSAYNQSARRYAVSQAANQIFSTLPGQIMQSLAVGFAIVMIVLLLIINGSLVSILPMLAVYALAVVRMMPSIQSVFQGAAQIRYYAHTVDALHRDMTGLPLPPDISDKKAANIPPAPLNFTKNIELKNIQFSYPASKTPVLKGIDLGIEKNTAVAFAGTTGCGKTTLVDVIMGLLEPSGGSINVDGVPIIGPAAGSRNLAPWQRNFGYVPQQIFLSDDAIAANIAFGIAPELRDAAAVEQAAKIANLHEFITSELPEGYNTMTGERGIRLSGGQRQRVGIARALYHDPNILVMDEATSALDSVTEEAVMDAIHNLMHTRTIIIIAHRLSTIRECDMIYLMDQGQIAAQGTYSELLQSNARFQALAKAGESGQT
jgi:ABC-type multidrug transport system fused ATPase/permease subunit